MPVICGGIGFKNNTVLVCRDRKARNSCRCGGEPRLLLRPALRDPLNASQEVAQALCIVGAGTGMHGEQNVQTLYQESGVPFHGGKIFTYTTQWGVIRACGEADAAGRNRRNCTKLIKNADIEDAAQPKRALPCNM